MTLLSKMYGGPLKPGDPRRYIVEAIVGAMHADGVVTKDESEILERNLQEHEMFAGLTPEVTRILIEMADDSIALAGGCLRRIPYLAKGLPARSHRMAAYAVACEVAQADGVTAEEVAYLNELRRGFLLSDDEARALYEAGARHQGMAEVEWRTRQLQSLMPWYLECMALMAGIDGTVTEEERHAVLAVLKSVADMALMTEKELQDAIDGAFRRVANKDADVVLRNIATALESITDRYWGAVYTGIVAVADGYSDWRRVWLMSSVQEAFRLSDEDMDKAMHSAKLFPIKPSEPS